MMTKRTSYHSTNGKFTGKTVTESSGGYTKSTSYNATGSGLSRTIMGPGWKATSTTTTDPKGNTRTTKYWRRRMTDTGEPPQGNSLSFVSPPYAPKAAYDTYASVARHPPEPITKDR